MKHKMKAIPLSEIRPAKRTKQFRETRPMILYMTYILTFPDGEVWMKQTQMVNDLAHNLKQMILEKKSTEWKTRALALWHKNECWWKDNLGVEHLIMIEDRPRSKFELQKYKWGTSKEGLGAVSIVDGPKEKSNES